MVLGLLTIAVYALLFGIYSNNDIDNTWSTAWIYNFYEHGITRDIVFKEGDANYWGVRFFSQIFCYIYGAILSYTGYTLRHVLLISLVFAGCGAACWYLIARKLLQDRREALTFIFMLLWSGVFFAAANKARTDAMVFFLMSFSILLWLRQYRFFSMLIACAAVETHPIGGITFFYILAYVLCHERKILFLQDWKALLQAGAGLTAGFIIYLALHHQEFGQAAGVLLGKSQDLQDRNFLAAHFWGRDSFRFRYLPELALFAAAFIAHFIIYRKKDFYFPLTVMLLVLSTFIFRRGNPHYAVFVYPAFLMLTVHVFGRKRPGYFRPEYLLTAWLLFMLPQYLYLAWRNAPGRQHPDYIQQLQNLNLPKSSRIYGMPADWFALYDHPGFRSVSGLRKDSESFIIEHQNTVFSQPGFQYDLNYDPQKWRVVRIKTLNLKAGGQLNIYQVLALKPHV